jgi:hypothetical protein
VSAEPFEQEASPGVCVPIICETGPLHGGSGSSMDQNWLIPCRARPFDLYDDLDRRVKTEIPV